MKKRSFDEDLDFFTEYIRTHKEPDEVFSEEQLLTWYATYGIRQAVLELKEECKP